jgi:hypothetical protein
MITHMESCFWDVLGRPTIKSTLMSSHFHDGMGRGWSVPDALRWLALTLWHVSHSDTYLAISLFILVHQKFWRRSWYILVLPGWIENLDRCASSRICLRSWWSLGTTIRLLNHRTPWWSVWKHLYLASPWDSFNLIILIPSSCIYDVMILFWRVDLIDNRFRLPWGMISRLSFLIWLQRVSLKISIDKQWQCALRLSASTTTLALPGW